MSKEDPDYLVVDIDPETGEITAADIKKPERNKNTNPIWSWQRYFIWAVLFGLLPLMGVINALREGSTPSVKPIYLVLGFLVYAPIATFVSLIFFPRKEIIIAEPKDQESEE